MLPCIRSRRHRGREGPAGGWAETPTGLWTTSAAPSRRRSSKPTADRWADCDWTRPRSFRADDSPGETKQESIINTKVCLSIASILQTTRRNQWFTCELSKKLLGRDIGDGVEVPAIAMATVWLIMLLPSPSASSPVPPAAAPWGQPGRPHWLWDSSGRKKGGKRISHPTR